eukprot:TRINITY_DN4451_c0_g2_i1.p1 TRINITY_DN4451_c0_g2~~TRINITY_DN4451_c0_g2_i1.p1  ORF type:complete len:244 (+),score=38.47 TRINITY_DN4451_c0_g2_i1:151-882(+)
MDSNVGNLTSNLLEVNVASSWWLERLDKDNLTAEQLGMFRDNFVTLLKQKYDRHWYPETPERGNGYRSLFCSPFLVDKIILEASRRSYIGNIHKRLKLEESIIMWVDPGNVVVKYFDRNDDPIVLYSGVPSSPPTPAGSPQRSKQDNQFPTERSSPNRTPSYVSSSNSLLSQQATVHNYSFIDPSSFSYIPPLRENYESNNVMVSSRLNDDVYGGQFVVSSTDCRIVNMDFFDANFRTGVWLK